MNYKYITISIGCILGGTYAIWKSITMGDVIQWPLFVPGCLLIFFGGIFVKNAIPKK